MGSALTWHHMAMWWLQLNTGRSLLLIVLYVYQLLLYVKLVHCRDLSACTTLKRVPGAAEGELVDQWIDLYHLAPNEEEFPLRNKQVVYHSLFVTRTHTHIHTHTHTSHQHM